MCPMNTFQRTPIDEVREFWDRRPCNVRHSQKPRGTREYFDEVEARKYFVEPHIPGFADFERWRGKRVLEVGCGIGTDTINFARAGATVQAVELSEESLDIARRRAEVYGVSDRIDFRSGNAEELDRFVPVEAYDLVYSFGVIHHTPHPGRVLEQARQYLRRGGMLKVMVYHRWSWRVAQIVVTEGHGRFWAAGELVAKRSEAQAGSPVSYVYSRRELTTILKDRGFRPLEMRIEHIFPYRVSDYTEYRYSKPWHFRLMPDPLFRALERRLGWHLCVTAMAV
jgi:2-polyprenyl-3-methyl-5-hydroxy-6-metoxy-1,4-benzoquinol methylase